MGDAKIRRDMRGKDLESILTNNKEWMKASRIVAGPARDIDF